MALTKLNFGGNQQALVAANIPTLTNTQLPTISSTKMPAGSVLQLLHTEFTSTPTFTGASYSDTGFNLSITPSATSSKIFMIFDMTVYKFGNNTGTEIGGAFKIVRDSTDIKAFEDANAYTHKAERSANNYWEATRMNLTHLDSPSTTSSTNYKLQATSKLQGYVQMQGPSKVTLMEIAG